MKSTFLKQSPPRTNPDIVSTAGAVAGVFGQDRSFCACSWT